jgi:hypothetical protein
MGSLELCTNIQMEGFALGNIADISAPAAEYDANNAFYICVI